MIRYECWVRLIVDMISATRTNVTVYQVSGGPYHVTCSCVARDQTACC